MKSIFFKRVLAYLIDSLIISFVSVLFTFWIPISKEYKVSYDNLKKVTTQYVEEEIDKNSYIELANEYEYVIKKESFVITIIQLIVTVAYVGTYSYYNEGRTIGKKIMKIKVSFTDGNFPTHNMLLLRTILIYGVFINLISNISIFVINKKEFFSFNTSLDTVQSFFVIISLLMVIFRKDNRGLHDFISNTKVVSDK